MPRISINLHNIDDLTELDEQQDWQEQLSGATTRRAIGPTNNTSRNNRGFREHRFGGSEALDRKRSERRKHVHRTDRRAS